MYHIVACDDEVNFTAELRALLGRYGAENDIEIKLTAFKDGSELIGNYPMDADLIFLDIQMEKMNGLQAAEKIRQKDAEVSIIFLTSLAQYALEGYKYDAVNYIVKPIKYARLKAEMDKWLSRNEKKEAVYLLVENDTGKYKLNLRNLSFIETFNRNLMLHTGTENIICYRKMNDMERELAPHFFVRCHTGYLVNLFYVRRIEKTEIELINGETVPVSQLKRKLVMEKLTEYWGDKL